MRVKVGDKVYSGEEEPVMVLLNDDDKERIENMGVAKKYCVYPSKRKWTKNNYAKINMWMNDI